MLHVVDRDRRAQQGAATKMGFAEPNPQFAQLRHTLVAHAECGAGDKHLIGRIVFVDRAFVGL